MLFPCFDPDAPIHCIAWNVHFALQPYDRKTARGRGICPRLLSRPLQASKGTWPLAPFSAQVARNSYYNKLRRSGNS